MSDPSARPRLRSADAYARLKGATRLLVHDAGGVEAAAALLGLRAEIREAMQALSKLDKALEELERTAARPRRGSGG